MADHKKLRVAVLYGGRSGEHEISLQSAASVLRNLDPARFEPIPIAIDKQGRWLLSDVSLIEQAKASKSLPVFANAQPVLLPPNPPLPPAPGETPAPAGAALVAYGEPTVAPGIEIGRPALSGLPRIDVVFPAMHGPLCEDGTVQGLFELADVPYVGCGVLASAVAMDKEVAKRLARDAGLAIVPYLAVRRAALDDATVRAQLVAAVAEQLSYPCFVKPSCLGSSVGVHKVKAAGDLLAALADAFRYDRKVLIERAVSAREIEVAVLESPVSGAPPLLSIPGEISPQPHHEFYSYAAKYLDENGAALLIPAALSRPQIAHVQRLAAAAFTALECEGMGRVDFFLDRHTGIFYFNEVNTIPGFTSISMYPKMFEASGIPYRELLTRLIELALLRAEHKRALVRDYHS